MLGTSAAPVTAYDIDQDPRYNDSLGYDVGADQYLATPAIVGLRLTRGLVRVTANVGASASSNPSAMLVGGRAPDRVTADCSACTASLQLRVGHRLRTIVLRLTSGGFTGSVRLRPGTYRFRVVIRNPRTHRTHVSAWRTIHVPIERKGAR